MQSTRGASPPQKPETEAKNEEKDVYTGRLRNLDMESRGSSRLMASDMLKV